MKIRSKSVWRYLAAALRSFFLPPQPETPSDIEISAVLSLSRERIVTIILRTITLLGIPAIFFAGFFLAGERHWLQLIVAVGTLLIIAYLAWNRHIDYRVRAIVLVSATYLFLLSWMLSALDEFFYSVLLAFVVMSTFLFGRWGGVVAYLVSMGTIFAANVLVDQGQVAFQFMVIPFTGSPLKVIQPYIDWTFFTGIVIVTLVVFLDDFDFAWRRERTAVIVAQAERDRVQNALDREQVLLRELQQAYDREAELSRLKSLIISNVSHEFRTPLAIISNSTDLLTRHHPQLTAEKREQIQARLDEAIRYLTNLLQDVEMVDSINSRVTLRPKAVPLNRLMHRLHTGLKQQIGQNMEVQFGDVREDERLVVIDEARVKLILFHLVANAGKYSPPTEPVTIDFGLRDDCLIIEVADKGIGLFPEDRERIFDLFYRGKNVNTRRGLGLGLFIVKTLVEAMDGRVIASSAGPDRGTVITVELPVTIEDLANNRRA